MFANSGFLLTFGMGLLIVGVVFFILRTVARCYKQVSPNVAAVITGRKHTYTDPSDPTKRITRGFRIVVGGGTFVIPILEKMQEVTLNTIPINVTVSKVPDKLGALVNVVSIANVKILSDTHMLPLAVERFLGNTEEEIRGIIGQTLEGNLRGIVGTMTIEELLRDRVGFTVKVLEEAGTDLSKMGLGVDVLKIQDIRDERGYIEALGKTRTAEVIRDANVGTAEAERETNQKTSEARRLGEVAKADADRAVSDVQRLRDIAIAENAAAVGAKKAQIPIIAQVAQAESEKQLNITQIAAEKARVTAEIELQEESGKRNAAQYNAEIVVKAEKAREALIIEADARQQAATRDGEAFRIKAEKEGLGEQAKQTGQAQGKIALAAASQAELEAAAAGNKAGLLAVAAGKQASLVALAEGELAMARAIDAKAEAFRKLDGAGRLLMILQAMPPVIDALGQAGERVVKPMADAMGDGLSNIDEVRVIDFGPSGGKNMLAEFANTPATAIFGLVQKLRATELWPTIVGLAKQAGVDVESMVPKAPETPAATS